MTSAITRSVGWLVGWWVGWLAGWLVLFLGLAPNGVITCRFETKKHKGDNYYSDFAASLRNNPSSLQIHSRASVINAFYFLVTQRAWVMIRNCLRKTAFWKWMHGSTICQGKSSDRRFSSIPFGPNIQRDTQWKDCTLVTMSNHVEIYPDYYVKHGAFSFVVVYQCLQHLAAPPQPQRTFSRSKGCSAVSRVGPQAHQPLAR
jgi:hypothetical protein